MLFDKDGTEMIAAVQIARLVLNHLSPALTFVAVDFGVTQVVDIRQGCHAALPKHVFLPTPYSA
ncbi:MAG: hypothetical protein F6K28_42545 [Microcoleus sp. SIO2G3]|nr:hypothetical protein [Microcoleus sp. SIO2G3]